MIKFTIKDILQTLIIINTGLDLNQGKLSECVRIDLSQTKYQPTNSNVQLMNLSKDLISLHDSFELINGMKGKFQTTLSGTDIHILPSLPTIKYLIKAPQFPILF